MPQPMDGGGAASLNTRNTRTSACSDAPDATFEAPLGAGRESAVSAPSGSSPRCAAHRPAHTFARRRSRRRAPGRPRPLRNNVANSCSATGHAVQASVRTPLTPLVNARSRSVSIHSRARRSPIIIAYHLLRVVQDTRFVWRAFAAGSMPGLAEPISFGSFRSVEVPAIRERGKALQSDDLSGPPL